MDLLDPKRDAIVHGLLAQVLKDRSNGTPKSAAEYQAQYPGYEDLVAEELEKLDSDPGQVEERPPSEVVGSQVGHYHLQRELGRGGQGAVFLADDDRLDGRQVALKLMTGLTAFTPEQLARFEREAKLVSRLDHPGIATVYEFGRQGALPFVAMRYVEGEDLATKLATARRDRNLKPRVDQVVRWIADAARVVHHAHEAGVVHRDIKPSNLMIAPDGQVVLLDFGLARDIESEGASLTRSGDVFGTPAYMAPEQIESSGSRKDPRTDVYGLGAVLYEALTLHQPFRGATQAELYQNILNRAPEDPRRLEPAISRDLQVVLETAMAKDRAHRYRTAEDFAADLVAIADSRSIAARPTPAWVRVGRWARREPGKAVLVTALIVAVLAATGLGAYLTASASVLEVGEVELERRRLDMHIASAFGRRGESRSESFLRSYAPEDPGNMTQVMALAFFLVHVDRAPEALDVLDLVPTDIAEPCATDVLRQLALRHLGREHEFQESDACAAAEAGPLEHFLRGVLQASDPPTPDAARLALPHFQAASLLVDRPRVWVLEQIVMTATTCGEYDTAHLAADAIEYHFPDSSSGWFYIGIAHVSSDVERAMAAFERSIELDPTFAQPYSTLSVFEHSFGNEERALELYETSIRLTDPGTRPRRKLRIARTKVLERAGDLDGALAECDLAIDEDPENHDVWFRKAELLEAVGLREEAVEIRERAFELEAAARPRPSLP